MSTRLARHARRTSSTSAARSRAPSRAARTRPRDRTSPAPRARTRATRSSAARAAQSRSGPARPPYNRGQVLYRLAEMMEARAADLAALCSGRREVERAIDRVVWYAGWADKLPQVLGGSNPVAGPYFNFTVPEPTGVVAILAPDEPALEGLVSPHRAGDRRRQRRRRRRVGDAPARSGRARRGARDVRLPRRRRQPAHRLPRRTGAGARGAHGRQRDRRHRCGRRDGRARGAGRRQREARRAGARASRARGRSRAPRAQDRLASDRHMSADAGNCVRATARRAGPPPR